MAGPPHRPTRLLAVSVRARTPGQSIEIAVNGQALRRQVIPADQWTPLVIRGPWKPGVNVLSCVGQGQTVVPPGDNRPMLFAVREPRWTSVPPGPDATVSP